MIAPDQKLNIKTESNGFDPIPADKYTVEVFDVNMVTQFNKFQGIEQELLNFQFVILEDKKMDNGDSTKGRFLWKRCSQSFNKKAWLRKLVTAALGHEPTEDEQRNFHPHDILGKQVDVMVEQQPSADGSTIYNNIISFAKASKELPKWEGLKEANAKKDIHIDGIGGKKKKTSPEDIEKILADDEIPF